MEQIFMDDCMNVVAKIQEKEIENPDYILTSPPDMQEIGLDEKEAYKDILTNWYTAFMNIADTITIVLTDRKFKGTIIPKSKWTTAIFEDAGWDMISYKIWRKTDKINLYRLTYAHVMTFRLKKKNKKYTSNNTKPFKYDTFLLDNPKVDGYANGYPQELCDLLINQYTNEDQIVFDPFMGSGTTALSCRDLNRSFIGSELYEETFKIAEKRLAQVRF